MPIPWHQIQNPHALVRFVTGSVNARQFGAKGDGSTDDTAAIQAAINEAAATNGIVVLPPAARGKSYQITRLYLHYDALNNPGFPQTNAQAINLTIRGSGPASDTSAASAANRAGAVLVSTDATGPAIFLDGGAAYSGRQVVLDGISIVATSTDAVIRFRNANFGCAIRNVTIKQFGTGGGIDWDNPWINAAIENVYVESQASAMTAGSYGIRVRSSLSGGGMLLDKVYVGRGYGVAGRFDMGVQIGGLPGETDYEGSTSYLTQVSARTLVTQFCNAGTVIGARVRGMTLDGFYSEGNLSHGLRIAPRSGQVSVRGGLIAESTADEAVLVDAGEAGFPIGNIEFSHLWISQIYTQGIRFADPTFTAGRVVNCRFTPWTGDGNGTPHTAIVTGATATSWDFVDNTIDNFDGLTAYDNPTRVNVRTDGNSIYRRGKVSAGNGTVAVATGLWMGAGVPDNSLGVDGDRYWRSDAPGGAFARDYIKASSAWIPLALEPTGAPVTTVPTNGAETLPDALAASHFIYNATDGIAAFTIGPVSNTTIGRTVTITVRNANGTAPNTVTVTWNAIYKMAAWTNPAQGFSRTIVLHYNGTNWIEVARTAADVPN